MEETKSNHRVNIVRIEEILPHPNADRLGLVRIGGYQCVVKLGEFAAGDLAVYIQPDSVVPEDPIYEFLWAGKEFDGPVPDKYRRIRAVKLRKQESEGLLLPIKDLREYLPDVIEVGDDVAPFLDITHYEPPEPEENHTERAPRERGGFPRSFKGWVYYLLNFIPRLLGLQDIGHGQTGGASERGPLAPVYDVDALKNHQDAFTPEDNVMVTEKIHGSNARYVFANGKLYAGSRKLWKSVKSNCIWRAVLDRFPWIESYCKDHEGAVLYGEVVPTQKFADGKPFSYGCADGDVGFFPFDVHQDGEWYPKADVKQLPGFVPVLYEGPYDAAKVAALADGESAVVGANHIREGVVVSKVPETRKPGVGRCHLKLVSNEFLRRT